MIRSLKKVDWPDIMRNEEYDSIKPPLHLEIRQRHLRMLGHIAAITHQPKPSYKKRSKKPNVRVRPQSSLLNTLINDLRF